MPILFNKSKVLSINIAARRWEPLQQLYALESTIRRTAHNAFRYKSCQKESRKIAKRVSNKIKQPHHLNLLWFFSNEKNFKQDQKVNKRTDMTLLQSFSNLHCSAHQVSVTCNSLGCREQRKLWHATLFLSTWI